MSAIGMHKRENSFMFNDYTIKGRCWEFPIGPVDPWDEAVADDRELFPRVHIHISTDSTDCDGPTGSSYVKWPDESDHFTEKDVRMYVEEQRAAMVGTLDVNKFWRHAVGWAIDFTPTYGGNLTLEMGDGEYDRTAHWGMRTDEGGHRASLEMCTDDDCDTSHTVYDQFAEMAGY